MEECGGHGAVALGFGEQSPETVAKFEVQKAELEKEFPQARFVDLKMTARTLSLLFARARDVKKAV